MNKWQSPRIRSSEITPEAVYLNRRQFMQGAAVVTAGALLAACAPKAEPTPAPTEVATFIGQKDELGSPLTSYEAVTGYNNYTNSPPTKKASRRWPRTLRRARGRWK